MLSASISAYIRNVVSGVRSSCVTAETNVARRWLRVITPCNKPAKAIAANETQTQAANSEIRMGDHADAFSPGNSPGNKTAGTEANNRAPLVDVCDVIGARSALGSKSAI